MSFITKKYRKPAPGGGGEGMTLKYGEPAPRWYGSPLKHGSEQAGPRSGQPAARNTYENK